MQTEQSTAARKETKAQPGICSCSFKCGRNGDYKQGTEQFLLNIIPNTFVGAFSEGNVLQVLLFFTSRRCAGSP
jgi:Na+/H+-dicarboxylate symporter